MDSTGKVRCSEHNLEAALRRSRAVANPQRQFYTCPLPEGQQCGFFLWKDQLPNPETSWNMNRARVQHASASTPADSPAAKSNRFPPLITPTSPATNNVDPQHKPWPTSPSKRSSPYTTDEARRKRFKAIQEALSSHSDSGPTNIGSSSKHSLPAAAATTAVAAATSTSATGSTRPVTPQSTRAGRWNQTIKEALQTPQSPPHTSAFTSNVTAKGPTSHVPEPAPGRPLTYKLSDLGFDLGGRRPVMRQNKTPPPPPPPPFIPPSDSEDISLYSQDNDKSKREEEDLWDAVSPSSSIDEVASNLLRQDNLKGKGKQKLERYESEDGVNWFMNVPPTKTSPLGLFPSTQISSSPSSSPDKEELSGDKIQSIVDWLSDVPEYVRKLERKLAATERSNAIKAERIKELEEEIKGLKFSKREESA